MATQTVRYDEIMSPVAVVARGKPGATATPVALAGGTASVAPTTGAHNKGEIVFSDNGDAWYCTVAGTPGTWVKLLTLSYVPKTGIYPGAADPVLVNYVAGDTLPRTYLTADGYLWFGDGTNAMDAFMRREAPGTIATANIHKAPYFQSTGYPGNGVDGNDPYFCGGTVFGPPTTGTHSTGEIVTDNDGRLWYCTVGGTPGTWVRSGDPDGVIHHPVLEAVPQTVYGHSWAAADGHNSVHGRWIDLIGPRMNLGPVNNRSTGGFNAVDITSAIHGNPQTKWTVGHQGIVYVHVGGNDMIQADPITYPIVAAQIQRELESALVYLTSASFRHSSTLTQSGVWTPFASPFVVGESYHYTTAASAYLQDPSTLGSTKCAVHYLNVDGVSLHGRHFSVSEGAGAAIQTIDSETFPTPTQWPANNGIGHGVVMLTGRSAAANLRITATATLGGGAGTPAYTSINGISIPSAKPPLIVVLADPRVVDYASAAERAAIKTAIDNAVSAVNTYLGLATPAIYTCDLDVGWPTDNSLVGTDHLHPTDAGERFITDRIEECLRNITSVPWGTDQWDWVPDRPKPLVTNKVTTGTAEQVIHSFNLRPWVQQVEDVYRISVRGYAQGTGNAVIGLRVGTTGTTSDPVASASVALGATANQHFAYEFLMTVRGIGTGGTLTADGFGHIGTGVWQPGLSPSVINAAMNTYYPFFLTVTASMSASTLTFTQVTFEKVNGIVRSLS